MNRQKDDAWKEAKHRCRLNDEEIGMAKELGFQPKSLIKNIPGSSQPWKAPVREWVRSLYEEKFGSRRPSPTASPPKRPAVIELQNPDHPWPDKPEIPAIRPYNPPEKMCREEVEGIGFEYPAGPPSDQEMDDQNAMLLRRQCLFRWAAQSIAVGVSQVVEVQKVAAFGAVASPLRHEVPRFSQFRRHRVQVFHECGDLDLAVWMTDVGRLKEMQKALKLGLSIVQDTPFGGVAPHQVDVHVMDAATGNYRGRLCSFRECPKQGQRQCFVPGCGAAPFLQQFEKYRFRPEQFEAAPKVILFDRGSGFLVRIPRIQVAPDLWIAPLERDDDVPF